MDSIELFQGLQQSFYHRYVSANITLFVVVFVFEDNPSRGPLYLNYVPSFFRFSATNPLENWLVLATKGCKTSTLKQPSTTTTEKDVVQEGLNKDEI